jgi:hypothetical protein
LEEQRRRRCNTAWPCSPQLSSGRTLEWAGYFTVLLESFDRAFRDAREETVPVFDATMTLLKRVALSPMSPPLNFLHVNTNASIVSSTFAFWFSKTHCYFGVSFMIPGDTEVKAQPRGKRNMSSRPMRKESSFPSSAAWNIRTRECRTFFIPSFSRIGSM